MTQTAQVHTAFLEKCLQQFIELGVKSVTMQHIAESTGTSKTSLYELYNTKEDLVNAVIQYDFDVVSENLTKIQNDSANAIDELLQVSEFVIQRFGNCNPCLLFDLQKYYSESWENFMRMKQEVVGAHILQNLYRGQKEGLYRKDFNEEIIARIYFSKVESFFDEEMFPQRKFPFVNVHREFIVYHLRGIASKKGNEIINISLLLKNRIA